MTRHKQVMAYFADDKYRIIMCDLCLPPDLSDAVTVEPQEIPIYNSQEEAYAAGWRTTKNPYLVPENRKIAILCPECVKKYFRGVYK